MLWESEWWVGGVDDKVRGKKEVIWIGSEFFGERKGCLRGRGYGVGEELMIWVRGREDMVWKGSGDGRVVGVW